MIVERTGCVKLERGQLEVTLRRFTDREMHDASRHLREDINGMRPATSNKSRFRQLATSNRNPTEMFLKRAKSGLFAQGFFLSRPRPPAYSLRKCAVVNRTRPAYVDSQASVFARVR